MYNFTKTLKFSTAMKPLAVIITSLSIIACSAEKSADSAKATPAVSTNPTSDKAATSQAGAPIAADSDAAIVAALQANLDKSQIGIKVKSALPTAMPGIYWATFEGAPAMFTDATGTHLIQGDIFQIGGDTPIDVGGQVQAALAKEALAKIDKAEMIIAPAVGEMRAAVYVFTDPTCAYCQKLHSELDAITKGGIEVRYLAWPRSEEAVPLTERIWCSSDRLGALTMAKEGKDVADAKCDNPVKSHMALGHALGVSGTPAVFTESGLSIGGYLPADELIKAAIENR